MSERALTVAQLIAEHIPNLKPYHFKMFLNNKVSDFEVAVEEEFFREKLVQMVMETQLLNGKFLGKEGSYGRDYSDESDSDRTDSDGENSYEGEDSDEE